MRWIGKCAEQRVVGREGRQHGKRRKSETARGETGGRDRDEDDHDPADVADTECRHGVGRGRAAERKWRRP